jgi:transposase-like protein
MGRNKYRKELKSRISLDAIKSHETIAELASEYEVKWTPSVV